MRSILIMAGGTGGHVFPALAVADYIHAQGWQIFWLGTKKGLEAKLVPPRGYAVTWLHFSGVRGKGLIRVLMLPVQLLWAFVQSASAIFKLRPDVVLGMGGYTAFPGGIMAVLLARPLVVHEQNSIAGLTNRVLVCMADKVLVAFPSAFSNKVDRPLLCKKLEKVWCGNPVRKEITEIPEPAQRMANRDGNLRILVVGGSLGAAILNEIVPKALRLIDRETRPTVVHQAGLQQLEALKQHYHTAGVEAELKPFIDDIATHYEWCDLIICRAGAMTIAELAAAGVASVLIPYPHAVDDHQSTNAAFLSAQQAAILIPQAELSAAALANIIIGLTRETLLDMAIRARELGKPQATAEVAKHCMGLAK